MMQACLCKAIPVGLHTLRQFHQTEQNIPVSPQANFPYPRQVCFYGESERVELQYTSFLDGAEEAQKMLFVAKYMDTQKLVLVKFMAMYGEQVHCKLAAAVLAPPLHYVGRQTGLAMVVMELLYATESWNRT